MEKFEIHEEIPLDQVSSITFEFWMIEYKKIWIFLVKSAKYIHIAILIGGRSIEFQ